MRGVIAVVHELMLASRITSLLKASGASHEVWEPEADVSERLRAHPPSALLLDLAVDPPLREALLAWTPSQMPVMAFGPHVDTAAQEAARRAGCAAVTTNGALGRDLPRWLACL